jgi:ABC-type branched-subunit amino acid transport system ATPase component
MTAALDIGDLHKSFGGVRVLRGFELTIAEGAVAILGQNGAGKTTLLNIITRLVPADSGSVSVFGHNVLAGPAHHLSGYGVTRTFQVPRLLLDQTVLDNVTLGPLSARGQYRARRAEATRRAEAALADVGLAADAGRVCGKLPFGARKLVELARALAVGPRLLLLDEPAAGLSDAEERRLAGVLAEVRESGITLLLIEHRMALVTATASRVVMLDEGAIVFDGSAPEAMASAVVRERYLGSVTA